MTDWLKYEWEWNEQEAVFQVDLQYWELLPALAYPHLVFVSVAPRNPKAEVFSHAEERRVTALQHTLAEQLEDVAIFIGELCFYGNDKNVISSGLTLSN